MRKSIVMSAAAGVMPIGQEQQPRVPFDLSKEYDLSKYGQRFSQQVSLVNPLRFFTSKKRILEANDEVIAYNEKAKEGEVLMTEAEIKSLKESSKIAGGAIHPDTQKIIPWYMRLSGFVVFNMPIVMAILFVKVQTPLFGAFIQWCN